MSGLVTWLGISAPIRYLVVTVTQLLAWPSALVPSRISMSEDESDLGAIVTVTGKSDDEAGA
jgi:hypothetical protein